MMDDHQNTHSISSLFDLLNPVELCENSVGSCDINKNNSIDSRANAVAAKLKKSEGDSKLMEYEQENLKNITKIDVFFCQNDHGGILGHQECRNSKEDYVNGQPKESISEETQDMTGETDSCSSNCKSRSSVLISPDGLPANGIVNSKLGKSIQETFEIGTSNNSYTTLQQGAAANNGCDSDNIYDGTAASLITISSGGQNLAVSVTDGNSSGTCKIHKPSTSDLKGSYYVEEAGDFVSGQKTSYESVEDNDKAGDNEDHETVVMRPNRHSLHRRSTHTGVISSAFAFLSCTDSVFDPPAEGGSAILSSNSGPKGCRNVPETEDGKPKTLDLFVLSEAESGEDNADIETIKCVATPDENFCVRAGSRPHLPPEVSENSVHKCSVLQASSKKSKPFFNFQKSLPPAAETERNGKLASHGNCGNAEVILTSERNHTQALLSDDSSVFISSGADQKNTENFKLIVSSSSLPSLLSGGESQNIECSYQRDSELDHSSSEAAKGQLSTLKEVNLRRSRPSKQETLVEDDDSADSSDEDAGVYAESFRRSNWIRIDDNGELELVFPAVETSRTSSASRSSTASEPFSTSTDVVDLTRTPSPRVSTDEIPVFPEKCPSPRLYVAHKRSESTSTTLSEREFKKEYVTRRKCLIQRQNSSKEYHRFSAKVYDEEKSVILEKGAEESDFGLHILDSQPAYITRVAPGSAADRAGVEEGQILVAVNGTNVLSLCHYDIVALITDNPAIIQIQVATSDFQPSRDLQASLKEGYMQKLGSSSSLLMRRWKKRYFILRQDSCLYYYKHKNDTDPLGAIPLAGYTFSRHLDTVRDYCFKADKYGARTYYFMTEGRDDMTEWVGALSEAAARSKKRKESFVSVSSHNVGLPALEVRRPECSGYLLKVGNRHKTWRRRYCVLKDACLYYYKNLNSLSALGVAHLHGYKVDPAVIVSKKHAFGLIPPDDMLRTFQFSAENETDRLRWVDAMIRSIQRWVQIDNDC